MPDTTVVVVPLWKALRKALNSPSGSAQSGGRRWARPTSVPSPSACSAPGWRRSPPPGTAGGATAP